jgi:hypothetical protein
MTSMRKTALAAGVLYLLTYVSSIPAALLLGSTLSDPNYILGAGADGQLRLAALLDIVNGITAIGTAVALFSVMKRHHEGLAIGFVASRIFEAAILFVGILSVMSIAVLRETAGATTDPASLSAVGLGFATLYKVAFILGTGIPALNALLLGLLLYRSGLVPRAIPALGLVGSVTFTSWIVGWIFGITEPGTPWHGLGVAPIFFWELAVGLWLTFKGFRKDAPLMLEAAEAETARSSTGVTGGRLGVTSKAGAA